MRGGCHDAALRRFCEDPHNKQILIKDAIERGEALPSEHGHALQYELVDSPEHADFTVYCLDPLSLRVKDRIHETHRIPKRVMRRLEADFYAEFYIIRVTEMTEEEAKSLRRAGRTVNIFLCALAIETLKIKGESETFSGCTIVRRDGHGKGSRDGFPWYIVPVGKA